jgi:hypothetical protein
MSKQEEVSDNIMESLEALQEALKVAEYNIPENLTAKAFEISKHKILTDELLSNAAKTQMAILSKTLIMYNDNKDIVGTAIYLVTKTRSDNKRAGIERIAKELNKLAEEGLIAATLTDTISSLELARGPMEAKTSVVFAYPLIKPSGIKRAKELCELNTDDVANNIIPTGDLQPDPEPNGTVMAVARIMPHYEMVHGIKKTVDELVQEEADRIRAVLPRGTVYLGATRCDIFGIAVPFELRFKHPLLEGVKEVRLNHIRVAARNEDENVVQGNLLLSVDYMQHDGTNKYVIPAL